MCHAFNRRIHAGPFGGAVGPDVHVWFDRRRIVQVARPQYSELRTRGRECKQMGAAIRAELPSDLIATVGRFCELSNSARDGQRIRWNKHIHGAVCSEMLAVATPTHTCRKRFTNKLERDIAAQAVTGSF